ncbi:phage tail protein [Paenibacillus polymyxa]|uniref:phage tail-collar fiber domain-containing protein n=1 Tax=Paenibacillus polymyxa TaxID=1406 RepID=UPI002AB5157E|nr:phage tail protein [Paenibacillus polymyxa]MDY7993372.1 phage tail protein [Paenibacillus polymyxa]MDY8120027.1 phage tail protein [Paenibacillus polymyxa]
MAFDGIEITNRGRNLLAKAEAGLTKITYTKFSVGDGKLSGQLPTALKALINEKVSFPVSRLKIQSENVVVPGFDFGNQGIPNGFFFREVGLWATDPDLGEILYAYANSGEGAEYIDAQNTSAVLKKLFNFELTVSNTAQVTVVVDDTIIYATPQDVADALKNAKDYTDTQIANVKVPDATTTVKGIVRLSADYKSQSVTTVPNSKALFDLYNIVPVDRGKVFQSNFNFALGIGVWRVDYPSLNPATDNSPPGAYPKGVLFVSSVNVTEGLALIQKYVDDTGGIYNRVRTVAGTWLSWDGLASKTYAQRNLRLERAVEFGADVTGAGPAFFDFHTSGNAIDYDSRIIAEGGTTATGNGKITIQAATTALTGKVETSGQVWVAKNTQFGSSSALSLPIGDGDTGLNWFSDGGVDFYSNNSKVAALSDGVFKYYEADGSWKVLRDEINNLKQSVVDGKGVIAGAINGKGGHVSASNTHAELAAAITGLPVKRFASGTFNGQTASASGRRQSVTMPLSVNSMGFTPSKVYVHVKLDETEGTLWLDAWIPCSTSAQGTLRGRMNNTLALYGFVQQSGGFTATMQGSYINDYAGGSPISRITAYEWEAYE